MHYLKIGYLFLIFFSSLCLAHGFEHDNQGSTYANNQAHTQANNIGSEVQAREIPQMNPIAQINQRYLADIKPLFQRACFDCHTSQTRYPWYHKLPGIKQLIDHDIRKAQGHLKMDQDFPFVSHSDPDRDLKAIGEAIDEGEMPPAPYLWMHSEAKWTDLEKTKILEWVKTSQEMLGQ